MEHKKLKNIMAAIVIAGISQGVSAVSAVGEEDRWQMKQLLAPSQGQLERESEGDIVIYTDLHEETVDLAMNEQFDRIENMMFVRMVRTVDGEDETDDDCDD